MKLATLLTMVFTLAFLICLQDRKVENPSTHSSTEKQSETSIAPPQKEPLEPSLAQALSRARHQVRELTSEEIKLPENHDTRAFAANPGQQLIARFSQDGMSILSGKVDQNWQAKFHAVGGAVEPMWQDDRVEYRSADLTEWVVNRAEGFEQGWTVERRGAGGGEAGSLKVKVDGVTARKVGNGELEFLTPKGEAVLSYSKLVVSDASGQRLAASMQPAPGGMEITWNDTGAKYPVTVDPLIATRNTLVLPTEEILLNDDAFGWAVATDGLRVAVSAPGDDNAAGPDTGCVYVFVGQGATWALEAVLTDPLPRWASGFGYALALHGDTLIVSSPDIHGFENRSKPANLPEGAEEGHVYVFGRVGGDWILRQTIIPERPVPISPGEFEGITYNGGDWFGFSLAMDGNTLVVGSPRLDAVQEFSGVAYVFTRTGSGAAWTQQATLLPHIAQDPFQFGNAVDVSGDTVIVGSRLDHNKLGSADLFTRSGGIWHLTTILSPPLNLDFEGAEFGYAVAVQGDLAFVSEPRRSNAGSSAGRVYAYERAAGVWSEPSVVEASDVAAAGNDFFGGRLVVSGDWLVVGDSHELSLKPGAVYLFQRNGATWTQHSKLEPSLLADGALPRFGHGVDISGGVLAIGSYEQIRNSHTKAGGARVYHFGYDQWYMSNSLEPDKIFIGAQFGGAVAISGDTALIGMEKDNTAGLGDAGAAYVFSRGASGWKMQSRLVAADPAEGDNFGHSVALLGDTALVGAWRADVAGKPNAGTAYVFQRDAGRWAEQAKLEPLAGSGAYDEFGNAVSLSETVAGTFALVGAWRADAAAGFDVGRAYVFKRSGANWTQEYGLARADEAGGDLFGASVAISGYVAVVGAPGDDTAAGEEAGSATVFERTLSYVVVGGFPVLAYPWVQRERLAASPAGAFGEFGGAVAATAEGATLLIGAPGTDNGAGGAWVYERSGNLWPVQARLSPDAAEQDDRFGASVALNGETALIGAPWDDANLGSAWLFTRSGVLWTRDSAIIPTEKKPGETFGDPSGEDQFGTSVALTDGYALIGAPLGDLPNFVNGPADIGRAVFYSLAPPIVGMELREGTSTGPRVYSNATYNLGSTERLKPKRKLFYIYNPGNVPLVFTEFKVEGDFNLVSEPMEVLAFETRAFSLRMGAETAGMKTGRLILRTNFPDQPLFEISIVGEVTALPGDGIYDADADGIADFYEIAYLGTLTLLSGTGDYDGDGVSDVMEFIAYSDATDAQDFLSIVELTRFTPPSTGGVPMETITLTWSSRPERVYFIEYSTDLSSWVRLDGMPQVGAIGQSSHTFSLPVTKNRYFRVSAQIP